MKNPLLRLAPAVALAAPIALGLYARPAAQAQTDAPAQPAPQTQTPAATPPPATPNFRTDINYVRVDVIISDKAGNPVNDLRQQDFEVTEDGKPQTIQSFKLVNIKESSATTPVSAPVRIKTVADEQMQAAKDDVRLFGIFLDDYHVRLENSMRAREPVARFIENQLFQSDLISVMYPLTPISDVMLTQDHANVASAIRAFTGRKYDYKARNLFEERYVHYVSTMEAERIRNQVSLSAIKAMIMHMGGLREGRKSIILVTEGWGNHLPAQVQDQIADEPRSGGRAPDPIGGVSQREQSQNFFDDAEMMSDLQLVTQMANRYNTDALYGGSPRPGGVRIRPEPRQRQPHRGPEHSGHHDGHAARAGRGNRRPRHRESERSGRGAEADRPRLERVLSDRIHDDAERGGRQVSSDQGQREAAEPAGARAQGLSRADHRRKWSASPRRRSRDHRKRSQMRWARWAFPPGAA